MHELLLDICKRKIDNGMTFEDILDFIRKNKTEAMFSTIEERVKEYIHKRESTNIQKIS
ncbi:MAG: hypothetical protein L3J43_09630 [Sulfurovum sp.]|nr:hypothetical protein [Sulfurovum sp.]